jgi:PadR family transcriptional regulator, regulatory protein PadR
MQEVRMTLAVLHVLRHFLEDMSRPRYGYDLMQATGYPSGKLYPILARLQHGGWLARTAEQVDPAEAGRPARYTYTLTADGAVMARQVLAQQSAELSPPRQLRLRPRTQGGTA